VSVRVRFEEKRMRVLALAKLGKRQSECESEI
jgi:hypothetical protein